MILDKAKEYYENNKDRLSKQARDIYNILPEEKKYKKREYRRNQHYNMTEKKKKKKENMKKIDLKICLKKKRI